MGELSKRMMVTGGNVTGITDQLVSEGLVVREDSPRDRRAYIIKLTPEGRRSFRKMAELHEKWIVDVFGGMDEKQRSQLHELLAALKDSASSCVRSHGQKQNGARRAPLSGNPLPVRRPASALHPT
jgi:DNA-binding MarR family transcriptional regulator